MARTALLVPSRLALNAIKDSEASADFLLPAQMSGIEVRVKRPTSSNAVVWAETGILAVRLVVLADGVPHVCAGKATGGRRTKQGRTGLDLEIEEYLLKFTPTWGFFGARSGETKRLGERSLFEYKGRIEIDLLAGELDTQIEAWCSDAPAPLQAFHSSVAFDAATDAQEVSGDGVLSLSHTATGSDLAAFAGVGDSSEFGGRAGSTTYDGTPMTEHWDAVFATVFQHAGYSLAGIASGAQTVTNTLVDLPDEHALGVISMTGVHQTAPVGTPETATGASTTAEVTVGSVGADDLVCANLYSGWLGATPGADETERYEEQISAAVTLAGTTQAGSAGGVMTMTRTAAGFSTAWGIGAIAFKPSTTAGNLAWIAA